MEEIVEAEQTPVTVQSTRVIDPNSTKPLLLYSLGRGTAFGILSTALESNDVLFRHADGKPANETRISDADVLESNRRLMQHCHCVCVIVEKDQSLLDVLIGLLGSIVPDAKRFGVRIALVIPDNLKSLLPDNLCHEATVITFAYAQPIALSGHITALISRLREL